MGCRTATAHKVRVGSVYGCFSLFFFLSLSLSSGAVCCLPGSLLYLVNTTTQLLTINGGSIPLRRLPLCALTELATTYPGHPFFFFLTFSFSLPVFLLPQLSLKYMNLLKLETRCSKSEGKRVHFLPDSINLFPSSRMQMSV